MGRDQGDAVSETKWTPGPWEVHRDDDGQPIAGIRERGEGRFVALTQFDAEDCRTVEAANARRAECTANARLIAAAPSLAYALALVEEHDAHAGFLDPQLRQYVRAALARARGES
jgi:hypothetical protein